jgi:hypothetical protein
MARAAKASHAATAGRAGDLGVGAEARREVETVMGKVLNVRVTLI